MSKDETGWVIERAEYLNPGSGPYYLTVGEMDMFDWTPDSLLAIRFARRQDAEMVSRILDDDVGKIAEHMWCGS